MFLFPQARARALSVLLAIGLFYAITAHSATFTVDRFDDDNGSCTTGDCTLREALLAAQATPETDTVILPPGRHILSIPQTTPESLNGGSLVIADFDVEVIAPDRAIVDAQGISRVFVFWRSNSRLEGLEITGGRTDGLGGGVYSVESELELANVWIHRNDAGIGGGLAIEVGTIRVTDSSITDNISSNEAGGIYVLGVSITIFARLEISNSTISGNVARTAGGAFLAFGTVFLDIEYTTVANNTNRPGDSTMFGFRTNTRAEALYLLVEGTCTPGMGTICMYLASRLDQVSVPNLGLEPLAFHGGRTPTHRLLPTSPAVDIVPLGAACPPTDQRGSARPVDGNGDDVASCDAGALELTSPSTIADIPNLGFTAQFLLALLLALGGLLVMVRR